MSGSEVSVRLRFKWGQDSIYSCITSSIATMIMKYCSILSLSSFVHKRCSVLDSCYVAQYTGESFLR